MLADELAQSCVTIRMESCRRILARAFWFLPTGFAQRRLDDLAELACDAFAVQQLAMRTASPNASCRLRRTSTGRGSAYASPPQWPCTNHRSATYRMPARRSLPAETIVPGASARALALIVLAAPACVC
jgi:hypothetical protein